MLDHIKTADQILEEAEAFKEKKDDNGIEDLIQNKLNRLTRFYNVYKEALPTNANFQETCYSNLNLIRQLASYFSSEKRKKHYIGTVDYQEGVINNIIGVDTREVKAIEKLSQDEILFRRSNSSDLKKLRERGKELKTLVWGKDEDDERAGDNKQHFNLILNYFEQGLISSSLGNKEYAELSFNMANSEFEDLLDHLEDPSSIRIQYETFSQAVKGLGFNLEDHSQAYAQKEEAYNTKLEEEKSKKGLISKLFSNGTNGNGFVNVSIKDILLEYSSIKTKFEKDKELASV